MRIISGTHKGRRIQPPHSFTARPTTDQAKEALFNILANRYDFSELSVLDLFAGTGSISFEFASRGANSVLAIEKVAKYSDAIRKTASDLQLPTIISLSVDVFKFIKRSSTTTYDIVFADPPFDLPELHKLPELILESALLSHKGLLIVEHPKANDFSQITGFQELRKYGKVHFSFFEKNT